MSVVGSFFCRASTEFVVWAPLVESLSLSIHSPESRQIPMERGSQGYFRCSVPAAAPDTRYAFRFPNGQECPDPASHCQPEGVHRPSQIVDHSAFTWHDQDWKGISLADLIIYELHVGTFTPTGTFEAILPRLAALREMGINAIEIMPVSPFPGTRNWGYDGVHPFAVQHSYGGPAGLKALVDACHLMGIAVILDVVFNHLGPEGNYLGRFGPYFTDRYKTPWGSAINFDGPGSDEVRNFFIRSALHWFEHYHLDALRLDAIHSIYDFGARHFLRELADEVNTLSVELGRKCLLIAESDLSDPRVIEPRETGGHGMDAQWCDDFHHVVHTLLTGEKEGYYEDFGRFDQLVKHLQEGFVFSGEYSPHRGRRHGRSGRGRPGEQFVVFLQNHDQVGNRMLGERLPALVGFDALKLAAAILLTSPSVPLLFMGEEYGEKAPFLYFVSHGDEPLIKAVREGRKREFAAFRWKGEPPDPQSEETFRRSILRWQTRTEGDHRVLLSFYAELIRLRRSLPALASLSRRDLELRTFGDRKILVMLRQHAASMAWGLFSFEPQTREVSFPLPAGRWVRVLDTADSCWSGLGSALPTEVQGTLTGSLQPFQGALYRKEPPP